MLPNLRLVLATVFSTATLAFFFVSFASFRIAQEGLDRLPSSRVPAIQQLGFDADEKWSQHDSLNGAVPEIFHSLPAAFLNPARDAGAQIPEITVIDVPAAPQPETSLAADTEADVSVQTAAPVPVAAAETPAPETPAAQPSQEPAPMPVVIANETHTSEAFVAPPAAVATPIPRPAPTLASKTGEKPAGKKNVRAAAKSTPRAIAKRAAKTSALPRRKLALRQAPKPAPRAAAAATNPASPRPAAKSTSSTAAPNPFSSLFQ
jgi:hypothetical protein